MSNPIPKYITLRSHPNCKDLGEYYASMARKGGVPSGHITDGSLAEKLYGWYSVETLLFQGILVN